MDRISTVSKAVDLFGAGKHGFKDGNLAGGVAPTDFNAAWFNGVQEEILRVIEAAGIAPAAGTLTQLLTALRSAGVFTTPAQFDASTKAATTAFVQKALGSFQIGSAIAAVGNFQASDAGSAFYIQTPGTYGLPSLASVSSGACFSFNATVNNVVIARAGADQLLIGAAPANSLTLNTGDSAVFVKIGGYWVLTTGTAAGRGSAGDFGKSGSNPGYFKLPSGIIVQWGSGTFGDASAVTFPLAFPSAVLNVTIGASNYDNARPDYQKVVPLAAYSQTLTGFFASSARGNLAANVAGAWVAIGV